MLIRATLQDDIPRRARRWRDGVGAAPALALVLALATALATAGCGSGTHSATPPTVAADVPTTAVVPTTATSITRPAPAPTTTAAPGPPAFTASAATVTAAGVPHSWHPGCPVGPAQLRMLRMTYWGFDARAHTGTMVVNAGVVTAVETVFRTLYQARFPIKEMIPVDAFGGSDNAAAAADDTSGFNCRYAVAPGPPQWSVHAFGEAIDVNDVQNPYVEGGTIIPPAGAAYVNRSDVRPGMAIAGGTVVAAFAAVGWQWGGRWTGSPDYQHFSLTGG